MRQAEVQTHFLESFSTLYPQLAFRGVRRFKQHALGPYSLILRVAFGKTGHELDMLCATLPEGFPEEVEHLIRRLQGARQEPTTAAALQVLVAPFFSAEARQLCRAAGLGYFDLAGNAFLDAPQVYLEISGKENPTVRERPARSPFEGRAERVVRRLLLAADHHWTMRDLAASAEVSLGLASMTTSSLLDLGVVTKSRAGLMLFKPNALLDAWVRNYDLRRSAFHILRCAAEPPEIEARLLAQRKALRGRAALTLWSGAGHLLGEQPATPRLALYWAGEPQPLARALDLSEDQGKTHVFVFQPYDESLLWESGESAEGLPIVHPLQLYLDLAAGDEEELRLAQRVRALFLSW